MATGHEEVLATQTDAMRTAATQMRTECSRGFGTFTPSSTPLSDDTAFSFPHTGSSFVRLERRARESQMGGGEEDEMGPETSSVDSVDGETTMDHNEMKGKDQGLRSTGHRPRTFGDGSTGRAPSVMGPTLASSSAALATGIAASRASRPLALTSATGHEEEAQAAATGHEEAEAAPQARRRSLQRLGDNEHALAEVPSSATGQRRRHDIYIDTGPSWHG